MRCLVCRKPFTPKVIRRGPTAQKHCSRKCTTAAYRARHGLATQPLKPRKCALKECGRNFKPSRPWSLYHSLKCHRRAVYLRRKAEGYYRDFYKAYNKRRRAERKERSRRT